MMHNQSAIVQTGIRAVSPLAVLAGLYLLFAGHNNPGGGFAAGLVFGAIVTVRTVTGLQRPTHARSTLAAGVGIVAVVTMMPLLWGNVLLDQAVISADIPILGKIKSGSALPFDIGVTAIVVGLVVALLDGLSAASLSDEGQA
ncbi:MAG: multisubunit Na+/H+ antiporter MnhB subunit [Acidimicrobiales bacterium]